MAFLFVKPERLNKFKYMKISKHNEKMGGEWVEFQVTNIKGLDDVCHWRKNSIYLMATPGPHVPIFEMCFDDDWWLTFNQIKKEDGMKLAESLSQIPEAAALSEWIISNLPDKTYLNILGI